MKRMKIAGILLLVVAFMATCWGMGVTLSEAQAKKVTLKLAHGARPDFSLAIGAADFKKFADQTSKGSLEVTIFGAAALGPEREFIEALMMGNVDLGITTGFTLSNLTGVTELLVYEMPWLIGDKDIFYRAFAESKSIQTIAKRLEGKGIKFLGAGDIGAYAVLAKKPLRTPADMAGMKIRVGENPLVVDTFKTFGARPVVVNFGELFTAFQQGVMDGLYTTTPLVHMTRTYEIAKELTQLNSGVVMAYLVMNLNKFNSLTKEQQAIIERAGAVYASGTRKASEDETTRTVGIMEKTGLKFHSLNAQEMEPFQKAMEPVYKTWRDKIGAEIFDETKAFTEAAQKTKK